jgi:hypothetical protein
MKKKKIVNFVCGYLDALCETDEFLVTRLAGPNLKSACAQRTKTRDL